MYVLVCSQYGAHQALPRLSSDYSILKPARFSLAIVCICISQSQNITTQIVASPHTPHL